MADDASARHYQHLLEAHTKVAEAYPKVVLLLSGGALALSVTFLERFTGGKAPAAIVALWIGWLGLAGSLLSIVSSMLISLGLLELVTDNYSDFAKGHYDPPPWRAVWIKGLNKAAAATLVIGLMSLAVFALLNVPTTKTEEECLSTITPKQSPAERQDSYSPPRPPQPSYVPPRPPQPIVPPQAPAAPVNPATPTRKGG